MMVIHLWNKTKKDDFVTPPAHSFKTVSRQNSEGPMSSVTMSEENDNIMAPPALKKKSIITRATVTAVLHRVARMKKTKDYNTVFKRATIMYAWEKGNGKSGMSARSVADLIRNECKVKLCPRTIQKKVKEGDIGSLPRGVVRQGTTQSTTTEISVLHLSHSFKSIRIKR